MPICPICRKTFHACGSCYLSNSYEYEFCSENCWKQSSGYKTYQAEFKALYSTINDAQKKMLIDLLEMSDDYLREIDDWIKGVEIEK